MSVDEKLREFAKYSLEYERQQKKRLLGRKATYTALIIFVIIACYQFIWSQFQGNQNKRAQNLTV